MLIAGVEEPLIVNEMIYSFNESHGTKSLSKYADDRLNRYSFVWIGDQPPQEAFSRLIRNIQQQLLVDSTTLLLWRDIAEGNGHIRSRWLTSKYVKEGWEIQHGNGVVAASKKRSINDVITYPLTPHPIDGGGLVLFGNSPFVTGILGTPALRSLQLLARSDTLSPSEQFLNWLAEQGFSVLYMSDDDLGREGLIMVGHGKLDTNELLYHGIVQTIFVGDEAKKVWRYSG